MLTTTRLTPDFSVRCPPRAFVTLRIDVSAARSISLEFEIEIHFQIIIFKSVGAR